MNPAWLNVKILQQKFYLFFSINLCSNTCYLAFFMCQLIKLVIEVSNEKLEK